MKNIISKAVLLFGALSLVAGCSSGVKRTDAADVPALKTTNVTQVQISLTDEAKKLVADNDNFNPSSLKSSIEDKLKALDLIKADAGQTMEVTVTSFRARSALTAVMFGFMAGNDNIVGTMKIKNSAGSVLKSADISASYALGGWAGGMTETRMGWLYGEFAKLAIQELQGTAAK